MLRYRKVLQGTIVQFERYAVHDGPGIRTVVYLKGCPLRCLWCHSPETQVAEPEVGIRGDRCIRCGTCVMTCEHGAVVDADTYYDVDRRACALCAECAALCPTGAREVIGRALTVAEVVAEIERDTVFYDESGGGVTISGGEPLMQPEFVHALLQACRARRLHTAVETCGAGDPAALLALAPHTDLFLYDLKMMDDERHRRVTGASNRVILENLERLVARGANVRVRFPLVPGVNDDQENVVMLGRYVASLGLRGLDLLPYHRAGIAKYRRLGRLYLLPDAAVPSNGTVGAAVERLAGLGLNVLVGG
jgi:pyruvate formate lyase activating enzyme